jgi:hypothetical protein
MYDLQSLDIVWELSEKKSSFPWHKRENNNDIWNDTIQSGARGCDDDYCVKYVTSPRPALLYYSKHGKQQLLSRTYLV